MATAKQLPRQVTLSIQVFIYAVSCCCSITFTVHMPQALQVLETLIIKDSDKLDIRDKQAVS